VSHSARTTAYLVLVLTFLIWSNSFLATRLLVGEQVPAHERLDPLSFVVARMLPVLAVTTSWLLASRRRRSEAARLLREHGPLIAVLGLLCVWLYNLPFAFGQRLVPPGTAGLITALNPVFTFLLALALRTERFVALRALGLVLAFAGVWQVVVHGAGHEVRGAYIVDALVLTLAPLSWAVYTVLGKRLVGVARPLVATYTTLAIGSAPALPLALLHRPLHASVAHWSPLRWGAALFLGLGCTLVGYWLWNVALRALPATTVSAFVFLNPPLALLSEWLWFGTVPGWGLLVGGALVLVGVRLCLSRAEPMPRAAPAIAESG
jgi:drug/metabolite transporter (DMT)-like permease